MPAEEKGVAGRDDTVASVVGRGSEELGVGLGLLPAATVADRILVELVEFVEERLPV